MTDPLRPALAAYLATHRIKLVHIWQNLGRTNAMMEWPYDPLARAAPEVCVTGIGDSAVTAVLAGLKNMGHSGLLVRLWLLSRIL